METRINFIGVGAVKSGSTWIGECLREHPEISFSAEKSRKEICFFNTENCGGIISRVPSFYRQGLSWYQEQIPRGGKVRGEFSVVYLPDPQAVRRIKKHFPNVKILVVLRNPVLMLYSFYNSRKRSVSEHLPDSFAEFFESGKEKELGLYYRQLLPYFKNFPSENIFVTLLDDIKKEPRKVVEKMYAFLEVDVNFVPKILGRKTNETFRERSRFVTHTSRLFLQFLEKTGQTNLRQQLVNSGTFYKFYSRINTSPYRYSPLSKSLRDRLKKYYLEDIQKLEELIGRNLSTWK